MLVMCNINSMKFIIPILIIFFLSCTDNTVKNDSEFLNSRIILKRNISEIDTPPKILEDTSLNVALVTKNILTKKNSGESISYYNQIYYLTNCHCELDSGVLQIKLYSDFGWTYHELMLTVNDSLKVYHHYTSDIQSTYRSPQFTQLELSKMYPSISDTIYGKVISQADTLTYQQGEYIDSIKYETKESILGHFRCLIKSP